MEKSSSGCCFLPLINSGTEVRLFDGAAGAIEVAIDRPDGTPRGIALIAHPHPLFAGTNENKVVQTLARVFVGLGYLSARPNFRGVGQSAGVHDAGPGETEDLLAVLAALSDSEPSEEVVLGGFSFGSFVQTHVAHRLTEAGKPPFRMVLVGVSVERATALPVPKGSLIIHGELDETVPLSAVLDWARPQELPVVVIPGADHFFHRRLTIIKSLVNAAWQGDRGPPGSVATSDS